MLLIDRMRKLSLTVKLVAVTLTILLVVVVGNYIVVLRSYRDDAEAAMARKAAAFTAVADSTKEHVGKLYDEGVFNTKEMVAEFADAKAKNPSYDYKQSRLFGTIPVVAGWTAAKNTAAKEHIGFKIDAFQARNPKHDPSNDANLYERDFRVQLLHDLEKQAASKGGDSIYRINKATNTMHYLRAIRLNDSCMMCHGKPGDPKVDPNGDGKDPLGFPMENWKVGQTHGAFEVAMPLDAMDAQIAGFLRKGAIVSAPIVIFATILLVFLLRVLLTKPLNMTVDMLRDIAEGDGDLTKRLRVASKDEIGAVAKWFNTFLDNIHDIILEVTRASSEVASASIEIAASSEQLSQGMRNQQKQTSQVSSAVEEISVSVSEVATKAQGAADAANAGGEQARDGGDIVSRAVEGMEVISREVTESAAAVGELGKRGEEIGEVIAVINDIADQTNLLALNAAIEAARAGEHGRGFAVVADEVRKLAERTTQATEEVAESIKAIQGETVRAVERMQTGTSRVDEGVNLARQAGEALTSIVESSQSMATMIESIAAAAEEQSSASNEMSRNVEQINAVTSESTQSVEQASIAATQLSEKAEQLQTLVGRFKLSR